VGGGAGVNRRLQGVISPGFCQFGMRYSINPILTILHYLSEYNSDIFKGNMTHYDIFSEMPDVTYLFTTERGSTYAMFADGTTVRNRSGAKHLHDNATGLQPRSRRTIFMSNAAANDISGLFYNTEIPTSFLPEKTAEGLIAKLVISQDEVGYKKGQLLAEAPFSVHPIQGSCPVEIIDGESPLGSSGGVHFGTRITKLTKADNLHARKLIADQGSRSR